MNKYQKRINKLLEEVTNLCDALLIPWFVSGRSAAKAYMGDMYQGGTFDVEITICAKDVPRFIEACEGRKGRFLEGYHNNSDFFGLYMKYVDTTTTLIDYNEGFSSSVRGMYIKINILRSVPTDKSNEKKCLKYEYLIEDTSKAYCGMSGKTSLLQRNFFRFVKIISRNHNKKLFFKLIKRYSSTNASQVLLRTADGQMHYFEKDRFLNLSIVEVENRPLWLPENPEEFFVECYGEKWDEYVLEKTKEGRPADVLYSSAYFLSSLTIPYHLVVEEMKKVGVNKTFFKRLHRMEKIATEDKAFMIPINNAWNNANRAGDLWNIDEYYKERKETIKYLYEIGELNKLVEQYKYYDEIVKKNMANNMGFKYDDELWEIYLEVKAVTENEEVAQSISSLANEDRQLQILLRNMERILNESI